MNELSLTQQLKQQQKLSPALIQAIRMLEVPGYELSQKVNEELQANPMLEENSTPDTTQEEETSDVLGSVAEEEEYQNPLQTEDFNYDEYINDDDSADYTSVSPNRYGSLESPIEAPLTARQSFGEYLKSQIYLTKMDKPDRHIAKFIIGNLDENGYLRRSSQELSDDLLCLEGLDVPEAKIEGIIQEIRGFDPAGVAASDLKDCILIQLHRLEDSPSVQIAAAIVERCFDDMGKRRMDKICQTLHISEDEYKSAMGEITRLNPKPSSAWTETITEQRQRTIIPDFVVENTDGELSVQLVQDNIPALRVSPDYAHILEELDKKKEKLSKQEKETAQFIRNKLDAANGFIDAIRQRNTTLLRTMRAIVLKQRDFFIDGEERSLKPMVLQDIAKLTGYDASTISRVTNSKYVQTPYGIFSLKFFFSEKMNTLQGEEVSTRKIKQELLELIREEDKQNPYTDDQMAQKMKEKGYNLARRTIAKYRDLYNIPTARLRKEL